MNSKLVALRIYSRAYTPRQLRTLEFARLWMELMTAPTFREATREELEQHAAEATAWANRGYTPQGYQMAKAEAEADGLSMEQLRMGEEIALDVAGSPEEHAAQVIDNLVARRKLVDPAHVRMDQDPHDPFHTIVHVLRD